jgi:hypothetical protein
MSCAQVPNLQDSHWRKLIAKVRTVYSGLLTESAIKGWETRCTWWDAVDIIGIDAYYPNQGNTVQEKVQFWQQYVQLAEMLHNK